MSNKKSRKTAKFWSPYQGNEALGRFVFGDGSMSRLVITKRQALEVGEVFVGISMTSKEWEVVKKQVKESKLVVKSPGLETFITDVEVVIRDNTRHLLKVMKKKK